MRDSHAGDSIRLSLNERSSNDNENLSGAAPAGPEPENAFRLV